MIIDLAGNIVGNLSFRRLGQTYSEGLLPAQTSDGITGYVDLSGKFSFVIPFEASDYIRATDFRGGHALIKTQDNPPAWNVINNKGTIVSGSIEASDVWEFSDGFSLVFGYKGRTGSRYGYVDTRGTFFVRSVLDSADDFKNGYARIRYQGRDGLLNVQGQVCWSDEIIAGKPVWHKFIG
jgi:hypothetical protein